MSLTDIAIRKLKPAEKPAKFSDERGLYLFVQPSGSKLWRLKYRFEGKEKVMPLGQYPDVSLAQAREGRESARKQLASGVDPMAQRKVERTARRFAIENSFANVARSWWDSWKAARTSHHAEYVLRRLQADVQFAHMHPFCMLIQLGTAAAPPDVCDLRHALHQPLGLLGQGRGLRQRHPGVQPQSDQQGSFVKGRQECGRK